MQLENNDYSLRNLEDVNVLLGKNGSGKSRLLRSLENQYSNQDNYIVKYITPERGGNLSFDPNLQNNIESSPNWLSSQLRSNQFGRFRQQSMLQFRNLELLTLREIEGNPEIRDSDFTFNSVIEDINSLLNNIRLEREGNDFKIYDREEEELIDAESISSGESEIISLAIECLVFQEQSKEDNYNWLMLDEPDVHLHPDLQSRFATFIANLVSDSNLNVLIATHSTALLNSFKQEVELSVGFITSGDDIIEFKPVSEMFEKVLPIFGAHPLSNVFNSAPILLVEGEDDLRVWQQALRTAEGEINLYPCAVDSIDRLNEYEELSNEILSTVYDDATGYSVRDSDGIEEGIQDIGCIKRYRLSCRAAENLILAEETLDLLETDWDDLREKIQAWIINNEEHPHYDIMVEFSEDYPRKGFDLKQIRNDLMGIIGSNKPWEVAVGQTIGKRDFSGKEHSIVNYLGEDLCNEIIIQ